MDAWIYAGVGDMSSAWIGSIDLRALLLVGRRGPGGLWRPITAGTATAGADDIEKILGSARLGLVKVHPLHNMADELVFGIRIQTVLLPIELLVELGRAENEREVKGHVVLWLMLDNV